MNERSLSHVFETIVTFAKRKRVPKVIFFISILYIYICIILLLKMLRRTVHVVSIQASFVNSVALSLDGGNSDSSPDIKLSKKKNVPPYFTHIPHSFLTCIFLYCSETCDVIETYSFSSRFRRSYVISCFNPPPLHFDSCQDTILKKNSCDSCHNFDNKYNLIS